MPEQRKCHQPGQQGLRGVNTARRKALRLNGVFVAMRSNAARRNAVAGGIPSLSCAKARS